MKLHNKIEPFFITEEIEAELTAVGYEFESPSHSRMMSIRELYSWQPGETLSETVSRYLDKTGSDSGRESRGECA